MYIRTYKGVYDYIYIYIYMGIKTLQDRIPESESYSPGSKHYEHVPIERVSRAA